MGLSSPVARQLMACLVILVGFVALMTAAWRHFAEDLRHREEFLLSPDQMLITTPPAWIQSNVLLDSISVADLPDPLDVRDRQLTSKIAAAVADHPWVKKVHKVVKQYPARVLVEVEYRRPVAMVEVIFGDNRRGLIPVDAEGVVLPTADFAPSQAVQFPRINVGYRPTTVSPGMPWGDPHVAEAAAIAAMLVDHWQRLKLNRIVMQAGTPHFELETADNQRIIWGSPPGQELPQEAMAQHKVQVILQKAAETVISKSTAEPPAPGNSNPPALDLRTAGRTSTSGATLR